MHNKTIKAPKNDNHENCEDCKREKAENEALIAIYDKLQKIDEKAKSMRQSVSFHQTQSITNRNRFHDLRKKLQSVPKKSKATMQLQSLGYQMAREMVEDVKKGKVARENQYLRDKIAHMYKNKKKPSVPRIQPQLSKTTEVEQRQTKKTSKYFRENLSAFEIKEESEVMEDQTQTTNFFSTKGNNSYFSNNSRYGKQGLEGLNLWLFEKNDENEEEMYLTAAEKTLSKGGITKKNNFLPTLGSRFKKQ